LLTWGLDPPAHRRADAAGALLIVGFYGVCLVTFFLVP
jgi:hypothetical protein